MPTTMYAVAEPQGVAVATVEGLQRISFGVFEVDLQAGELWKAGFRVRLSGQPFKVLVALLERSGEVVTREELLARVWGLNTNVDFEQAISGSIKKIREALGDSADNPRFIETLTKRGYRFIAPVVHEQPGSSLALPISGRVPEPLPTNQPAIIPAPASVVLIPETPSPDVQPSVVVPLPVGTGKALGRRPVVHSQVSSTSQSSTSQSSTSQSSTSQSSISQSWISQSWISQSWISLLVWGTCGLLLMSLASLLTMRLWQRPSIARPLHIEQVRQAYAIYAGPPNPETLLRLVTDGPRIYTNFLIDGRSRLASMDLNGAEVQPVSLPDDLGAVTLTDISRDGSRLIVRGQNSRGSEQPLWIVPTTGSSALRAGEVLAHDATWMPKGDSILTATGNELRTLQLATGAEESYAALPGRAFWPRWSPDGTLLRFTLLDPISHASSLWELDARTRHPHPLQFPELAGLSFCCGSWTADGTAYIFQADGGGESNIWSLGTGKRLQLTELTNGPMEYVSPLPGHTDTMLYFVGLEQPAGNRTLDQATQQFVPSPAFLSDARRVAYSRDGDWVAWTDTHERLWRARSKDGSGLLRLTEDDLDVYLAQWSPDGRQLVMMAHKPGETWQLFTVAASGGALHRLFTDERNLADPAWSPDGRMIVFGREGDLMGKESGPHTLQTFDMNSHVLRTLPGSEDLFSPRWSPDGRWIVALSLDQTRLMLFDTVHLSWRTLYAGGAADPVWSADSKSLFFHAFAEPHSGIMRVALNGSVQAVGNVSKLGLPSADDYLLSGVTPAGLPMIEPRVGSGNLYVTNLAHDAH